MKEYLENVKQYIIFMLGLIIILMGIICVDKISKIKYDKEEYETRKIEVLLFTKILVASDSVYVVKLNKDEVPECKGFDKAFYYKALYDIRNPEEMSNDVAFFCYNSTEDWQIVEDMRPSKRKLWGKEIN